MSGGFTAVLWLSVVHVRN